MDESFANDGAPMFIAMYRNSIHMSSFNCWTIVQRLMADNQKICQSIFLVNTSEFSS